MVNLLYNGKTFTYYAYQLEKEFETTIIENRNEIFGENALYIDVKKKIRNNNIETIPDGYLIDFSFESSPRLYIIENELSTHDAYKHIGEQLLKFATSYKSSGRKIKKFLLENILNNNDKEVFFNDRLSTAGYRNIDDCLEDLIFEKPVASIILIDQITDDLDNVLKQLTMRTDIIEFQTFLNGDEKIHKFEPFQQEIKNIVESKTSKINVDELDTIVVPAKEEGFQRVFLGKNCWHAIRISASMIDRLKYIAAYQVAPISAITYYAEIQRIEKYEDSSKYIVYFKDEANKIGPIKLPNDKGYQPQSPRYTSYSKLKKGKSLKDIF